MARGAVLAAAALTLALVTAPDDAALADEPSSGAWELVSANPVESQQVDPSQGPDQTRFSQRTTYSFVWNIRKDDPTTGPIIGTAGLTMSISEDVSSRTRTWDTHYIAEFGAVTGVATTGLTATVLAECRGDCGAPSGAVENNAPVTNGSVLEGDIPIESQGPDVSTSSKIVNVVLTHPAAIGTARPLRATRTTVSARFGATQERVFVSAESAPDACSRTNFTPTLVLNEQDPPAPRHAEFVADAQSKLDGLGNPSSDRPLHRQADKEARDDNRSAACKDFVPNGPGDSCDEYPYAATRESGPGVSQVGHVPRDDNSNAGVQFSSFIRSIRLHDGDAFYVDPNV
jgi:hypothetical protein